MLSFWFTMTLNHLNLYNGWKSLRRKIYDGCTLMEMTLVIGGSLQSWGNSLPARIPLLNEVMAVKSSCSSESGEERSLCSFTPQWVCAAGSGVWPGRASSSPPLWHSWSEYSTSLPVLHTLPVLQPGLLCFWNWQRKQRNALHLRLRSL